MKGFFLAILCVCAVAACMISCEPTKTTESKITFETLKVDTVCPLFNTYPQPAAHVSVSLSVPTADANSDLCEAVQHFVQSLFKDGAYDDGANSSLSAMVDDYIHQYLLEYLQMGPDAIDNYGTEETDVAATWMSYEESIEGNVLYNDNGLLSYQVRVYSYTGGAHGFTRTFNGVFDINQRQTLHLSHIFDDYSLPDLNNLLRIKLAKDNGCATVEELTERQIFFSPAEIEATENFYVCDSCINWQFDPYDIAPFSTGEVNISLTWDEVYPLMKSDNPVIKLAL